MKRFTLFGILVIGFLLAGCAAPVPQKVDLLIEPAHQSAQVYPASREVSVVGRDRRSDPAVILYKVVNEPTTGLDSRVPPQNLVVESLAEGLRQQGLRRGDRSGITVSVVVKELQAVVTRPATLYSTQAKTRIELIISHNGSSLTLDYNRENTQSSMTRPKVLFLEKMLDDQLSAVVTKMLEDQRVRDAINGRM